MEAGTLHQAQMKKKKMKHNLCYVGLVVLIILLFTPPLLRLLISEEIGGSTKNIEYRLLNCTKEDESISSTFADGVPQNILYKVKGNLLDNTPDEVDNSANTIQNTNDISSQENGSEPQNVYENTISDSATVREIFSAFKSFKYDSNENVSTINLDSTDIKSIQVYSEALETINKQENLFTSRGFSCTQSSF